MNIGLAVREAFINAIKHGNNMNDQKLVEVEFEQKAVHFRVRVRDEGSGLSGDALRKIFKPGYSTKTEGSGYGLFLALRMAREHGGTLEAEPIPRDPSDERGAIFELRLPMSGEPGSKPAREAS